MQHLPHSFHCVGTHPFYKMSVVQHQDTGIIALSPSVICVDLPHCAHFLSALALSQTRCCRISVRQQTPWAHSTCRKDGAISASGLATQRAEPKTWSSGTREGSILKPVAAAEGSPTTQRANITTWWVLRLLTFQAMSTSQHSICCC